MNPVPWLQMTNMISYQGLVRTFPSGAGDAFIGCFSHYYVQSGDVEAALKKAALFAAFSVTGKGTQSSYPSIEQFNEFLTLNE